ncbi:MAG: protein-disulfide reductase DsbD domain-containing protein [Pseudomonadota bacterium]
MRFWPFICAALLFANGINAASSDWVVTDQYAARLITAETAVTPEMSRISAGLQIEMKPGWKTYWEFPGEVGLPPELNWGPSSNLSGAELFYPAPERFTAFEIENFGYSETVIFPIELTLQRPGQGASIFLNANLLVCADVCIPADVDLSLFVDSGLSGPDSDTTDLLSEALNNVPLISDTALPATRDANTLKVSVPANMLAGPLGVFPHDDTGIFGSVPKITTDKHGNRMISIAVSDGTGTPPPKVTLTDGRSAVTADLDYSSVISSNETTRSITTWAWAALFAFVGGLILNIMPCVLPVLSIKFAGVLAATDKSPSAIRAGFLASSAGILAFTIALAGIIILLKSFGVAVGMGMQFQSPLFLGIILAILISFAANLFGMFEFQLPQNWTTGLDKAGHRDGLIGDFLTGAFASLLATPCSAPFLGTAITYAFTGSAFDTVTLFFALGLGLATPYLLAATRPSLILQLPKPGRWMTVIRALLGLGVAATALWITTLLATSIGPFAALAIFCLVTSGVVLWSVPKSGSAKTLGLVVVVIAMSSPAFLKPASPQIIETNVTWQVFDEEAIVNLVQDGHTVFVDVTADWCLTCKANKRLVLENSEVQDLFSENNIVLMKADWTRPDDAIRAYLEANNRFGIPFNIVYGPDAHHGIALPELLTISTTRNALASAGPSL